MDVESTLRIIEEVKNKRLDVKKTMENFDISDCLYFFTEDGDLDVIGHLDDIPVDKEQCFELIEKSNSYFLNVGHIYPGNNENGIFYDENCNSNNGFIFDIFGQKYHYLIPLSFDCKCNEFFSYGIVVYEEGIEFAVTSPDFDSFDVANVCGIEEFEDFEYSVENPLNQIMIKLIYDSLYFLDVN